MTRFRPLIENRAYHAGPYLTYILRAPRKPVRLSRVIRYG